MSELPVPTDLPSTIHPAPRGDTTGLPGASDPTGPPGGQDPTGLLGLPGLSRRGFLRASAVTGVGVTIPERTIRGPGNPGDEGAARLNRSQEVAEHRIEQRLVPDECPANTRSGVRRTRLWEEMHRARATRWSFKPSRATVISSL